MARRTNPPTPSSETGFATAAAYALAVVVHVAPLADGHEVHVPIVGRVVVAVSRR